ncbi:hypothetical protein C8Q77DRAFT_1262448 [Trametes polyzona]|nr:hypothetical protein C8Q77DRAFT_1262448 [Trametes polyzona]
MIPTALVAYDYLLTLSHEYRMIWKRGFSFPTALFLANRYGLILATAASWLTTFVTWQNDRRWAWTILVFLLGFVTVPGNLASITRPTMSIAPLAPGCFTAPDVTGSGEGPKLFDRYATASRTSLIMMDVIVLGVTWYRTYDVVVAARKAGIRSSLGSVMLRDGSTYFAHFESSFKPKRHELILSLLRINSVAMSRFMLNLRIADASSGTLTDGDDPQDQMSMMWAQQLNLTTSGTTQAFGAAIAFSPSRSEEDPNDANSSTRSRSGTVHGLAVEGDVQEHSSV